MSNQVTTVGSNYQEISRAIDEFIEYHPKNYLECVKGLLALLKSHFPALNQKTSPILENIPAWDADELAFIAIEYSGWTNETIHMFLDSRIRMHWDLVNKEIDRNVGEEMGALTQGIPHLEMMRQGHRKDLEIETDNVSYSGVTTNFVKRMRDIFKHEDNAYACGVLLAFEATATDEFKIVDKFLRKRKSLIGGELKKGSITDLYIAGHVDHEGTGDHPEDSHYQGLQDAMGIYITDNNIHRFVKGFLEVCFNMNMWWEQLTMETFFRASKKTSLAVTDSEVIDLAEIFEEAAA